MKTCGFDSLFPSYGPCLLESLKRGPGASAIPREREKEKDRERKRETEREKVMGAGERVGGQRYQSREEGTS